MKTKLINSSLTISRSPYRQQPLMILLFLLSLILIEAIFMNINIRKDSDMNYDEVEENFKLETSDLVDNGFVYIGNEWIMVPNIPNSTLKYGGFSFDDYHKYPYASRAEISSFLGWDYLGNIVQWNNCDKRPDMIIFSEDGQDCYSMLYMAKLKLPSDISTLHLSIPKINGVADVYCNGKHISTAGNTYKEDMVDFTCGFQSIPLTSNYKNEIELIICVRTFNETTAPGIISYPSLNVTSSDYKTIVASTAWIMYEVITLMSLAIFGSIISKTFSNRWKYYTFLILTILVLTFTAFDSGLFVVNSIVRRDATIILGIMVASTTNSFIGSLFVENEKVKANRTLRHLHHYVAALAFIFILLYFFVLHNHPNIATTIVTLFSFFVVFMYLFIVLFVYYDDPHSSLAIMTLSSFIFASMHMFSNDMVIYNIPAYSLFFIYSVFLMTIAFVYEYLAQNKQIKEMSEHLQFTIKEKTNHISEINRDLYNTNQQLIKNEEARKNVLSNVSHDLRTPITAIRGYAELLKVSAKNMSSDQVDNYLDNIIKRSQQMERIVSDIVELTRMESGANEFQFIELPLAELLDELVMMYQCDLDGTAKTLSLNMPNDDMLFVSADPKKISRVFENLISNAINYTGDEATITVNAWKETDNTVHVTVADDGIGIAADEVEHIFDRFYRAKNSGKNIKGTGLGLSIVKTIIDHHRATITVESTLGAGTTFHIVMKGSNY